MLGDMDNVRRQQEIRERRIIAEAKATIEARPSAQELYDNYVSLTHKRPLREVPAMAVLERSLQAYYLCCQAH